MLGFFQGLGEVKAEETQAEKDAKEASEKATRLIGEWNRYSSAENDEERETVVERLRFLCDLTDKNPAYVAIKNRPVFTFVQTAMSASGKAEDKAMVSNIFGFVGFAMGKLVITSKRVDALFTAPNQTVSNFVNAIALKLVQGDVVASEGTKKAIQTFSKTVKATKDRKVVEDAFNTLNKKQNFNDEPASDFLTWEKPTFIASLEDAGKRSDVPSIEQAKVMGDILANVMFLRGFLMGRKGAKGLLSSDIVKGFEDTKTFGAEITALQKAIIDTYPVSTPASNVPKISSEESNTGLYVTLGLGLVGAVGAAYYFSTQKK